MLASDRTILTELFGLAWPAPHRVVPNAATELQLSATGGMPALSGMVNRASATTARHTPPGMINALVRRQRPGSRLLVPKTPSDDDPDSYVDAGPLYAGDKVQGPAILVQHDSTTLVPPGYVAETLEYGNTRVHRAGVA